MNMEMDMELFLQKRGVKYVPVLVAQVFRPDKDGVMKKRKDMVPGWKYGIDGLGRPDYTNWVLNEKLYNQYIINQLIIDQQYENRRKESQDSTLAFPELIFAHDTRNIAVLDFDHKDELNRPECQMLLQNTPFYNSLYKGYPKPLVIIEDIHTFKHKERIVLHKIGKDTSLELLIGQFSYFRRQQLIYNTDKPFYVYKSLQELFDRFDCNISPQDFVEKSPIKRQRILDKNITNMDVLYTQTKTLLDRLITLDSNWGNNYDNWIWIGFVLHNIFCDYDINMGLELFDHFSQSSKFYDPDELEEKWEHIVRGAEKYTKQPATEHSLLSKIEELEEEKGIRKPRLLQPTSDDSFSSHTSSSSSFSSTDGDVDEENEQNPFTEIEELLKITSIHLIQQSGFRKMLMKVIHNIDDSEQGYEVYKNFLTQYAHICFTDKELGELFKSWTKTQSLSAHTVKILTQIVKDQDTEVFETKFLKNKETYEHVKQKFEKRCAKIRNPVCFVDLNKDGKLQIMKKRECEDNYENLKCMAYSKMEGKVVKTSFISKWFLDEKMKTFDRIEFNPDTPNKEFIQNGMSHLNLFNGLECMNYKKYPSCQNDEMKEELDLFLWLIRDQLCDGNLAFYEVFMKLLSHAIQKPGKKWGIMVVIKSIEGIGKGMFLDFFGHCMLGEQYYLMTDNADQILGNFNESRMNKLFINLNELRRQDLNDKQGSLKGAITENNIHINPKGKAPFTIRNETNYIITTNNDNPVPVGLSDRRTMAIETKADKLDDKIASKLIQFVNIRNKNTRFIAQFRDYLLTYDLSNFVPERDRVETSFYREMRSTMIPHHIQFLHYYFFVKSWENEYLKEQMKNTMLYREWKREYMNKTFSSKELYDAFIDYRQNENQDHTKYSHSTFYSKIGKLNIKSGKERVNNARFFNIDINKLKSILHETYHIDVCETDDYEFTSS